MIFKNHHFFKLISHVTLDICLCFCILPLKLVHSDQLESCSLPQRLKFNEINPSIESHLDLKVRFYLSLVLLLLLLLKYLQFLMFLTSLYPLNSRILLILLYLFYFFLFLFKHFLLKVI